MTKETTTRQVQELYPESDAATKREIETLANAISQFRSAMHHAAQQESFSEWQMNPAQVRRQSIQRVRLEWAAAALTAVLLGAAVLLPAVGSYHDHMVLTQAQQQEQLLKQREADTALLDQVTNELSETVPDSMRPLAELDTDYASYQTVETEKKNGRN